MSATSGRGPVTTAFAPEVTAPERRVQLFCASAYLFFFGVLTHLFGGEEGAAGPFQSLFIPTALVIQLTAIALLLQPKRRDRTFTLLTQSKALLLALAVIFASTIWSIDPEITLRRAVALFGTTAVGILIYVEFGRANVLRFFAITSAFGIVGSVMLALVVPSLGTHLSGKSAGAWMGLLSHKNQAAWATVIFLLAWLGTRKTERMKSWHWVLLGLGLLMLFQTRSATGIAAFSFGIIVLGTIIIYTKSPVSRPLVIGVVSTTVLIVAINFQTFFSWALDELGRDQSLTGRTSIWTALWPFIESKFWFGSGYLAFFDNTGEYLSRSNWIADLTHAHNAYVEILLDVGLVGLLTQIAFLVTLSWLLFTAAGRGDSDAAAMLAIVLSLAFVGIAGALFFRPNTGIWILIVAFACYAADSRSISSRGPQPGTS